MNKKILVAVHSGFTDVPAIQRALALASSTDVDIMLYSAVYDEYIPNISVVADQIQKMHQSMLDSEIEKLEEIKSHLVPVAQSVEVLAQWEPSVTEGITKAAEQFNADLIIVSSTRHSSLSRLFLSNTDWEILRHVYMPIIFAHQHENKPYKKVVIAVESAYNNDNTAQLEDRMITIGKWICEIFNAELHLAHAYPPQFTATSMDYMIPAELSEELKQKHKSSLNKLASKHNVSETNTHFIEDFPRIGIPKLAKDIESDLVIMGLVSRSFIDRFLIGSTTEYLLDHLECDVLTVHANYKAES